MYFCLCVVCLTLGKHRNVSGSFTKVVYDLIHCFARQATLFFTAVVIKYRVDGVQNISLIS